MTIPIKNYVDVKVTLPSPTYHVDLGPDTTVLTNNVGQSVTVDQLIRMAEQGNVQADQVLDTLGYTLIEVSTEPMEDPDRGAKNERARSNVLASGVPIREYRGSWYTHEDWQAEQIHDRVLARLTAEQVAIELAEGRNLDDYGTTYGVTRGVHRTPVPGGMGWTQRPETDAEFRDRILSEFHRDRGTIQEPLRSNHMAVMARGQIASVECDTIEVVQDCPPRKDCPKCGGSGRVAGMFMANGWPCECTKGNAT